MELIYTYVETFSNFIKEQEISFSQKFDVNFDKSNKKLFIKRKDYIKCFFGEKIENISLVIGKNGAGKTTLLDLLAIKMEDRAGSYNRHKDKYFILYHINDDTFAVEGYGLDLIKDIVTDLPLKEHQPIRNPYSIVIERNKENDGLYKYIGYMQFKTDDNGKEINEKIVYVNVRERYNDRYTNRLNNQDYTAFANRFYGDYIGFTEKYDFLILLRKNQDKLINPHNIVKSDFLNTSVYMKIETNFNYSMREEALDIKISSSKRGIKFKTAKKIIEETDKVSTEKLVIIKQNFIKNFLVKYIHESFNEGVLKTHKDIKEKEIKGIQRNIDGMYSSMGNKKLYDNQVEYLLKIIKLINDRIEKDIKLGSDNKYYDAISDFIRCLEGIEEKYFTIEGISIPSNPDVEEASDVRKLLSVFDKYNRNEYNNLSNSIKIEFKNLSEGEKEYLDIFTRIRESLKNPYVRCGDTVILILDEPDRSFHPEWSRKFIPILLEKIHELEKVESKYHVIISTHSPFMVSDLPSENLILLDSELNEEGKSIFKVKNKKDIGKTFANNIHTILSNEFFMKSTIGEFSKTKINESIEYMFKYKNFKNEKLKDDDGKYNEENLKEKKKEIKFIIDIIGESVIKRKLEETYRTTFQEEYLDYKLKIEELENEKILLEKIIGDKGLDNVEIVMQLLKKEINQLRLENGNLL